MVADDKKFFLLNKNVIEEPKNVKFITIFTSEIFSK